MRDDIKRWNLREKRANNRGSIAVAFWRKRLQRLAAERAYVYTYVPHMVRCPRGREEAAAEPARRARRRTEISNIRTARREAGQMSTVLTAESVRARRAFSMVSLQKCHAQSRAATRRDAAAPRPALAPSPSSTSRRCVRVRLSFSLLFPSPRCLSFFFVLLSLPLIIIIVMMRVASLSA